MKNSSNCKHLTYWSIRKPLKNTRSLKVTLWENHVDSKEGLARLRSSAHYMWNMLRCCFRLKFCLLLLLFFSHTKFFFTSAEMIASRRHITPENCRHKAFFAKVLDAKKGIFCKNPSIVARYFLNVWMSKKFVKCCTVGEKVWKWLLTLVAKVCIL